MACILNIETSTRTCSVAVSQDGALIFEKVEREGPNHAVSCGVFVDEALSFAESHAIPLDAVAVSHGPGSYTGLRIGLSIAKGVAYGRGVPLVTVPTLQALCVTPLLYNEGIEDDAVLAPMIDARRMEVYTAVYSRALAELAAPHALVVDADAYAQWLDRGPVWFFGDGAGKCRDTLCHPNARFMDDIVPLARDMFPLAERKLAQGDLVDVAYCEPFYLKEFVATQPKNTLIMNKR